MLRSSSMKLHRLQEDREEDMIAICLWSPPGPGKSSAIVHIQKMVNNANEMPVFNTDFWTDHWIHSIFVEEYLQFIRQRPHAGASLLY